MIRTVKAILYWWPLWLFIAAICLMIFQVNPELRVW